MKIIQAIPGRMKFEARKSSSVELCVAEWISGSRYRDETTVFAERSDEKPLLDVDIFRLPPARRLASWRLALAIREQVKAKGYRLIVNQQHIPTAARIAAFNRGTPVILQTHNFIDAPVKGRGAALRNRLRQLELQSLGGITLVSEATRRQFEKDWPSVTTPRTVISNGFDFSNWRTDRPKRKHIMVVGRTQETKGILESAEGVAAFLAGEPDWTASFVLSEPGANTTYFDRVKAALQPLSGRAEILTGIPFSQVIDMTETSSIAVVASKWEEPFGRTALEAHAAGIALISSGTGGLREISGEAALFLPHITPAAITESLRLLASQPELRERIAAEGAARVRRLFSLMPQKTEAGEHIPSMCERLDNFYDEVLARSK